MGLIDGLLFILRLDGLCLVYVWVGYSGVYCGCGFARFLICLMAFALVVFVLCGLLVGLLAARCS